MKSVYLLCLLCIMMTTMASYGQSTEWINRLKEIKIGKSDRTDVENSFSAAKVISDTAYSKLRPNGWGRIVKYQTDFGSLEVTYSTGKCGETSGNAAYDIEASKVIQMIFEPTTPTATDVLGFDLSKFELEKVEDVVDSFIYYDRREGKVLTVYKGKLTALEYGLSKQQQVDLDCL